MDTTTDSANNHVVPMEVNDTLAHGVDLLSQLDVDKTTSRALAGSACVGALAILLTETSDPKKNIDFVIDGLRVCLQRAMEIKQHMDRSGAGGTDGPGLGSDRNG